MERLYVSVCKKIEGNSTLTDLIGQVCLVDNGLRPVLETPGAAYMGFVNLGDTFAAVRLSEECGHSLVDVDTGKTLRELPGAFHAFGFHDGRLFGALTIEPVRTILDLMVFDLFEDPELKNPVTVVKGRNRSRYGGHKRADVLMSHEGRLLLALHSCYKIHYMDPLIQMDPARVYDITDRKQVVETETGCGWTLNPNPDVICARGHEHRSSIDNKVIAMGVVDGRIMDISRADGNTHLFDTAGDKQGERPIESLESKEVKAATFHNGRPVWIEAVSTGYLWSQYSKAAIATTLRLPDRTFEYELKQRFDGYGPKVTGEILVALGVR